MPDRKAIAWLLGLAVIGGCAAPRAASSVAAGQPCLAGLYDGGQMEMAAGLELLPSGRFRFALSYGALDEASEGRWRFEQGEVRLTSEGSGPGQARFADTALPLRDGVLLLERHGRLIRFRRTVSGCR